jgi:TolB protein
MGASRSVIFVCMRDRTFGRGGAALVVAALILMISAWATPRAAFAAYPGSNGRIAYAGYPGPFATDNDIFTVLPSGSATRQLTDNAFGDVNPSWSADGRRLAYVRAVGGRFQVFKMWAAGGEQTRVTHDAGDDSSPSFSPSGRRIAYTKDNLPVADGNTPRRVSIFTIRADGTGKRRIARHYAASPEYSPNGERIVFDGSPNGKHNNGIWTIDPDGSHLRRLSAPGNGGNYDQTPAWSPDGEHIVFLRCDRDSTHGCEGAVFLMRANGSYKRPILAIRGEVAPTFSPTGNRIALTVFEFEDCSDVYTMSLTGSNPHAVTHNCEDFNNGGPGGFAAQPSWQPLPAG